MIEPLTFWELRRANTSRLAVFPGHDADPWSANDWMVALVGEVGELANMLKKHRRGVNKPGLPELPTIQEMTEELADIQIYLDLLAAYMGVNLGQATREKFNKVSELWGLEERL